MQRAVIARDLKDEEYDPARHNIDHVWPQSKGGSNTSDNLRVIEKQKNLKKGAKQPRLHEMSWVGLNWASIHPIQDKMKVLKSPGNYK